MTNQVDVGSFSVGVWSDWQSSGAIFVPGNSANTEKLSFDFNHDSPTQSTYLIQIRYFDGASFVIENQFANGDLEVNVTSKGGAHGAASDISFRVMSASTPIIVTVQTDNILFTPNHTMPPEEITEYFDTDTNNLILKSPTGLDTIINLNSNNIYNNIPDSYASSIGASMLEDFSGGASGEIFNTYSTSSFSKAFSSFGFDNFDFGGGSSGGSSDLPSSTWGNLGSSLGDSGGYDFSVHNSFLDDQTFNFGGSSYTMFGSNDFITLPNFWNVPPAYDTLDNFRINSYISENVFGSYLDAQNRVSPLVLDLNKNGIETTGLYDTKVFFDIDADGFAEKVGWVKPTEGLLAIDTNNNGKIDDITELFGDDKQPAFDKLRQFDSNHDGKINIDSNHLFTLPNLVEYTHTLSTKSC